MCKKMSETVSETPTTESRKDLSTYCRFRPFIKFEMSEEGDKKAQCSVAFHKSLKNVLLKVGIEIHFYWIIFILVRC